MISNILLLYILIGSLLIVLIIMLIRLRKFKTWIKTRTKKRPMEEIAFLTYQTEEASEVHISGGGSRVPIGRVIIGEGKDDNAYVDVLMSDFDDDSIKPLYRSCGYIGQDGYIYKKLSPNKKPIKIGYTARPSDPNTPTTIGERTWRTLWLGCTLNAYLDMPSKQTEEEIKANDPKITKITGIGNEVESGDGAIKNEEIEQEEVKQEVVKEDEVKEDVPNETAPEEVKETPRWTEQEKEELDRIKKTFPTLLERLVLNMVQVKGGNFIMGADQKHDATEEDNKGAVELNESPKHNVTLDDYYIGKFPVTQAEWKAIMGSNPSECQDNTNYPVAPVSWKECREFLERLSYLVGTKFDFPTEAQWEYAARGGIKSHGYLFSGSNTFTEVGQSDYKNEVGSKKPNELGIFDMSGLVREWCGDLWGHYSAEDQTNPNGPTEDSPLIIKDPDGNLLRVVRSPAGNETVTNRKGELPELLKDYKSYGLRIVCYHIPEEFKKKVKEDNLAGTTPKELKEEEKSSKKSTEKINPVAICRHYSLHCSKKDTMSPEARACAYAVFYGLYNKRNYTEYYKDKPYGWKDTALLTSFVYSVIFITWYLVVKFILNERFIGYHFWAVPSVAGLYYPLWAIIRMIKIDRLENSQSIQAKLDLFNKSLRQGSFDKAILTCAGITAAFTLTFYRFDFLPLVWAMSFGVSTNMGIKNNKTRWRIDRSLMDENNDNAEWLEEEDEEMNEVKNPDGDISRSYNWVLERNYQNPNNLHGSLTMYFTDAQMKELRHINPFYAQRKEKHAKDYILTMFHQMKEHTELTARLRYIVSYINRTTAPIDSVDPLTKIQFTLDFVQEPNIVFAFNEDCKEIDMFPEYIRWPEETLYDKTGDCNSKALLAATLFHLMGHNVLYMFSRVQQHAAVGIELAPGWERMPNGKERLIGEVPVSKLTITYNGRKFLFCEVTMDGFSIGSLLAGMSYEDFEETIELPLYEPDVDDAEDVDITSSKFYYWNLDSEFNHTLNGSFALKFTNEEIQQLRDMNPFRTYGNDGNTYEQNVSTIFSHLCSNQENVSNIKELANYMKEQIAEAGLPELDLVQFALDFVQEPNITYCLDEKSASIGLIPEYMRFPDEVLFDKEGDCDCKSSLTAALFHELGYNVIFMLSQKLGHAAIGIECREEWLSQIKIDNINNVLREYNGKNYLYCETTSDKFRIGHIAEGQSIQDFETIIEFKSYNNI
ncbi:Formylglycine-generating enzyme, required for sulfatase activity, contains SUMF1/FGE domain [Prevotella sp. khp1]|uniref:formylglycine-generating enzyme family protein n=1 Tax=Prevotellaceae TaxID=171552 RepID=UPI00088CA775|nr:MULTISPECIES: SUMF1/EgtB/PvdO family nonheme iron enzyme [Prevotellaceae]QVJ81679.1 SUMF1/EgtB/PvdO family nonheme iron enzyme [Xylanibacter ruminicola]SDQ55226.1 Formylglycine-generating enzyme, required for sulfatase activity, contains SUMF1/FGE domain [Prevotella sp. khp1]